MGLREEAAGLELRVWSWFPVAASRALPSLRWHTEVSESSRASFGLVWGNGFECASNPRHRLFNLGPTQHASQASLPNHRYLNFDR